MLKTGALPRELVMIQLVVHVAVAYQNWSAIISMKNFSNAGLINFHCYSGSKTKADSEILAIGRLLNGTANTEVSGMGYCGKFYGAPRRILDWKFGRPHVIIDAQLASHRKASLVTPQDLSGWTNVAVMVSNFLNVLKKSNKLLICN